MLTVHLTLSNRTGLDLAPASLLVQTASDFAADITIANLDAQDRREVDAKSITAVLTLGAGMNARVRIQAEGPDEARAIAALMSAIENGLGEDVANLQAGPRPTRRQLQILKLMADGFSQKQVARRLGLSDHTVRHHVSRLYATLGVHDSAHAVMSAVRAGLLES